MCVQYLKGMVWNVGVRTSKFGMLLELALPDRNSGCDEDVLLENDGRLRALLLSLSPIPALPSTYGILLANLEVRGHRM